MAATGGRVVRIGRALVRFTESPVSEPVVFAIALGVYAAVSIALPLQAGRDLPRYLLDYAQLFDSHVVYPYAILSRTPGTGLVSGVLLELGPIVSEVGVAALYALSIAAWFSVSRRFGPVAALTTAAALLAYPGYVLLFHELASDALFAAAFALVAVLLHARSGSTDGRSCGRVGSRRRAARLRAAGRAGAPRPRARAAARGARSSAAPDRGRGVRRRRALASRRPRGAQLRAGGRLHRRPRRVGVAPLPDVRCGSHRRAGKREGLPGARARRLGGAPPQRPTARAGSTSRRSSRRAALACTTTSPCCPTGRGAGTTTTATSVASPVRRSARIPARTHGHLERSLAAAPLAPVRTRL